MVLYSPSNLITFVFCSWEEFCEDVAVEKAGFYMDPLVNKANMLPGIMTGDTLEMTSQLSENMSLSDLSWHHDEVQSIRRACKRVAWYFSSSLPLQYYSFLHP